MNQVNEIYDKEFVDPIDGFADDDLISPNDYKDCDSSKITSTSPIKSFLERDNFESELGSPSDEIYNAEFDEISKLNIINIIAEGDRAGRPIVCIYAFRLPSNKSFNHEVFFQFLQHVLDNANKPPIKTLVKAFHAFDRRYKKNLKVLAVIHPTRFIKFVWRIFQPFISIKFERKMHYMNSLNELNDIVPITRLNLPKEIIDYDTSLFDNRKMIPVPLISENNTVKPTAQFNVPLDFILGHHPESELPPIAIELVSFLRNYGLKTQGIFRLSGEVSRINRLQERINMGESIDFLSEDFYKNDISIAVIDASALLKVFLRSLGEPIITNALYPKLISSLDVPKNEKKQAVKNFVKLLPRSNYLLLQYIIEFLLDVANCEHENKMDANNLSVIFGPNLTWPTNQQVPISQLHTLNNFCYILIIEYEYIFSKD